MAIVAAIKGHGGGAKLLVLGERQAARIELRGRRRSGVRQLRTGWVQAHAGRIEIGRRYDFRFDQRHPDFSQIELRRVEIGRCHRFMFDERHPDFGDRQVGRLRRLRWGGIGARASGGGSS